MEQDCTEFTVLVLCHDSTGWDEMGDYFATEADTMIDIVRLTCRAHQSLPVGFLLLRYSVLFPVEYLSLLYLLVIS